MKQERDAIVQLYDKQHAGVKMSKTKKDCQLALERLEKIFNAKFGTKESEEAALLAIRIKNYEDKTFVIHTPGPLHAIQY